MKYRHLPVLAALLMVSVAVAQQSEAEVPDDEPDSEQQEDESAAEDIAEDVDESGLDVQGFEEEDDDDFVPTEDIPADQSIPFPTDI